MKSWMELVLTELTWLPKELCQDVILTEFTWLTKEKKNWVSVYRVGSTNKGLSCFGILSLIDLSVGLSWLRRWLLIILSYIWADLTIWKIWIKGQVEDLMCVRMCGR